LVRVVEKERGTEGGKKPTEEGEREELLGAISIVGLIAHDFE
jgi:hypothetical protein